MCHLFYDVDCLFMVLYSCFYQTKLTVILLAYRGVLCATGSVCMWVYIYIHTYRERGKQGMFQRSSKCSAVLLNPRQHLKSAVISHTIKCSLPPILFRELKYPI